MSDAAYQRRIERLEEENERLRQRLDQLKAAEAAQAPKYIAGQKLTPTHQRILDALLTFERVPMESLVECLPKEPSEDTLKVHISNMRRRLAAVGAEIRNVYGGGYFIHPADKERLRAAMATN